MDKILSMSKEELIHWICEVDTHGRELGEVAKIIEAIPPESRGEYWETRLEATLYCMRELAKAKALMEFMLMEKYGTFVM